MYWIAVPASRDNQAPPHQSLLQRRYLFASGIFFVLDKGDETREGAGLGQLESRAAFITS